MSLISLGFGNAEYWTSPALPHLRNNNKEFKITGDESSWIASLLSIGFIFGFLFSSLIVDRLGRKFSLLIFAIPQIISWVLIYLAKNVIFLYSARFIGGTGLGGGFAITLVYLGEISDKRFRGLFVTITKLMRSLGSILTLASGAFASYDVMNLILLSVPLTFVAIFIFMPESPYFYLYRNREEEAVASLSKFRGTKDIKILEPDIKRMKDGIIESKEHKNSLKILFQKKRHRKAFLIVLVMQANASFSGARAVGAFFQDILSHTGVSIEPKYAALILEIVTFFLDIPVIFLIDHIGRRLTILLSGIAGSISLTIVGLFFFLKNYQQLDLSSISWICLVALTIFKVASIGLFTSPSVLSSELFSIQVKSSAVSLLHILKEFFMFLVKLSFERLVMTLGIYGVFWIYAIACIVLSLTGFLITPETKGKNLEDIQQLLDS